ncbi:carbohydrate deacetylase [Marinilactibacillus psychrotolerans]|uniref:carbohydrate deacetylase n=1 Tax=Marinilactibacillus psychrotolerans TaxID=191770 RepID=UPI0038885D88
MGRVIINSDDFGYSRGINYGIMDAFNQGILTSTTLMTNTPGFKQAVELAKEHPKLGIGVHLTLTFLKPLNHKVNTLTDPSGNFHKLAEYNQSNVKVDLNELYEEWDQQIKKVIHNGIDPTHLDSHHHLHTFGDHQEVVIELARKYDLPVRGNFERKNEVKTTDHFIADFDPIGEWMQSKEKQQMATTYLNELYEILLDQETVEIMCHAGYIDQFVKTHTSYYNPRIFQTDLLIHSEFAQKLKRDSRIELVSYKNL